VIKSFFDDLNKSLPGQEETVSQVKQESPAGSVVAKILSDPESIDSGEEETNSFTQALLGPVGVLGEYYFPVELIGGCCPRVVGEEQNIVWNAAAEASDTERVHIVWQAKGDKIWYLAVRSSELSSRPNTWCPFASLLPGMKDALAPPVCYTYYSDEAATMMTIMQDGLQIHRGTSSVVRAKAERTGRALGDAPVIELVPERLEKLTPTPWFSLSMFEERARRILAAVAVVGAIGFSGLAMLIWFFAAMSMVRARADMAEILKRTETKSVQLMQNVQALRASPMREQLAKFAELNDGLLNLDALLEVYQVKDNKTLWRATVPPSVTSDRITELGGKMLDNKPEGVVIGNAKDSLTLGQKGR
jgi:hypothetical protein